MSTLSAAEKKHRSKEYAKLLKDPRWVEKSAQIKARDNHRCLNCGSTASLAVHHIRYKGMPWEAEDADLVTLCQACHGSVHDSRKLGPFFAAYCYAQRKALEAVGKAFPLVVWMQTEITHENVVNANPKKFMQEMGLGKVSYHEYLNTLKDARLIVPHESTRTPKRVTMWRLCPFLGWRGTAVQLRAYLATLPEGHPFLEYRDPISLAASFRYIKELPPDRVFRRFDSQTIRPVEPPKDVS